MKSWRINDFLFSLIVLICGLTSSLLIDETFHSTISVLSILQLAVVVIALKCNSKLAYISAFIEAVSYNLLFTSPRYSLQMFHTEDVLNLVFFLIVALLTSQLAGHYRRQQDALKQEQLRSSILLSVSHDLRTPLAAIIGTLTTLKEYMDKLDTEQKHELLDSATMESHRLHHYIENLLQATKLQHGALKVKRTDESLIDVVRQAILRFNEKQKRINLDCHGELSNTKISASLIEQAVFNVLDNALFYSPDDDIIDVIIYQQDTFLVIDIQDRGIGITAEQAEQMFDLFYRNATGKKSEGGVGLGLAVAKGIIEAHQGRIEAIPMEQGCLIRSMIPIIHDTY
ncbi:PAS domain-containing sensor histidine kinase [Vibrio sp.]|nr:PAS domain-containing sensor histidine kinase [Vibrio sp.]